MLDDATVSSAPEPRCMWCSAVLPSDHETACPSCGATLVGQGEAAVPGLTAIDADAILRNAGVQAHVVSLFRHVIMSSDAFHTWRLTLVTAR